MQILITPKFGLKSASLDPYEGMLLGHIRVCLCVTREVGRF